MNGQWRENGSKAEDLALEEDPRVLRFRVRAPRNPEAWSIHSERAIRVHDILRDLASRLSPLELTDIGATSSRPPAPPRAQPLQFRAPRQASRTLVPTSTCTMMPSLRQTKPSGSTGSRLTGQKAACTCGAVWRNRSPSGEPPPTRCRRTPNPFEASGNLGDAPSTKAGSRPYPRPKVGAGVRSWRHNKTTSHR